MNTRFFDVHGRPVGDLDARTIAISWTALRAIPTVIAVAVGEHKLPAVWSALRSGCIDVLRDRRAHGPRHSWPCPRRPPPREGAVANDRPPRA